MRGNSRKGRRVALIVWAAFAFVTWNVVFDRHVYLAAVQFTQQQIVRYQKGEALSSLDTAFSPRVGEAARQASLWGGAVVAVGLVLAFVAGRDEKS
jgi:hypothetical protein